MTEQLCRPTINGIYNHRKRREVDVVEGAALVGRLYSTLITNIDPRADKLYVFGDTDSQSGFKYVGTVRLKPASSSGVGYAYTPVPKGRLKPSIGLVCCPGPVYKVQAACDDGRILNSTLSNNIYYDPWSDVYTASQAQHSGSGLKVCAPCGGYTKDRSFPLCFYMSRLCSRWRILTETYSVSSYFSGDIFSLDGASNTSIFDVTTTTCETYTGGCESASHTSTSEKATYTIYDLTNKDKQEDIPIYIEKNEDGSYGVETKKTVKICEIVESVEDYGVSGYLSFRDPSPTEDFDGLVCEYKSNDSHTFPIIIGASHRPRYYNGGVKEVLLESHGIESSGTYNAFYLTPSTNSGCTGFDVAAYMSPVYSAKLQSFGPVTGTYDAPSRKYEHKYETQFIRVSEHDVFLLPSDERPAVIVCEDTGALYIRREGGDIWPIKSAGLRQYIHPEDDAGSNVFIAPASARILGYI